MRITETYRAFLYLKALTGETLCPPRWIDQAWHLHLEFPQDYAALEAKLGRRIEHRRDLSPDETLQSYQRGRSLWAREFGNAPPSDLWPVSKLGRENRIRYAVMLAFWCAALAVFALALTVGLSPVWAVLIGVGFMGGCLYYLDFWLIPVPSSPDTVDRSSCG